MCKNCELCSVRKCVEKRLTWSPTGNGEKAVLLRSASPSGPCCTAAFAGGAARGATAASSDGVTAECSAMCAAA